MILLLKKLELPDRIVVDIAHHVLHVRYLKHTNLFVRTDMPNTQNRILELTAIVSSRWLLLKIFCTGS